MCSSTTATGEAVATAIRTLGPQLQVAVDDVSQDTCFLMAVATASPVAVVKLHMLVWSRSDTISRVGQPQLWAPL